jgi:protoporphyrinogen/coproporphyrinogen III oxidase
LSETSIDEAVAVPSVIIIGGGISGLATAYFLSTLGIRSTIAEKSNRLGGLIRTESLLGCQLEAGPDSYLAAKPAVTELARGLGDLKSQIIGSNDKQRRIFVVRSGKLVPMPNGMVMIAPSQWAPILTSELFRPKTKLRFLSEIFAAPRRRTDDVSVAELVRDHFGEEVLEYVAEPLLAGVYGGDSGNLSAESVLPRFVAYERQYGSLIKGVRQERRRSSTGSIFLSFRDGMQSLTDGLAQAIAGTTNIVHAEAGGLQLTRNGWRARIGNDWVQTDHMVLACPAHTSASLLETATPELARELAAIPYSSAILTTLIYDRSKVPQPLNGFGFLVPRSKRKTISAATWINTKFPSRVPGHLVALRAFIVDPEATRLLNEPQETVTQLVQADFENLMHIHSSPIFASVHFWPNSMPQYVLGHAPRRARIAALTGEITRLHLVGNAYEGVGIPDCVRLAKETADRISRTGIGRAELQ